MVGQGTVTGRQTIFSRVGLSGLEPLTSALSARLGPLAVLLGSEAVVALTDIPVSTASWRSIVSPSGSHPRHERDVCLRMRSPTYE
jgi:hypothetical protein